MAAARPIADIEKDLLAARLAGTDMTALQDEWFAAKMAPPGDNGPPSTPAVAPQVGMDANQAYARGKAEAEASAAAAGEKKLVERDVYEAQQLLPPEQAALIKHLATVERCIEEGPVDYSYAESSECTFCLEWQTGAHKKDCAWVLLQFDRKPEATMTMVHEHALREDDDWKRRKTTRINRPTMDGHFHTMTGEALRQANEVVERSRAETLGNVRVYENPLVAPGRVYLMQNLAPYMNPLEVTRVIEGSEPFPRQTEYLGKFPSQLGDPVDLDATSEHPEPTAVDPARFFAGTNMTDALRYAMAHGSQLVSMTHDDITVDVPVSEVAAPDDDKVP
jgi:hypothetical protein